MNALMSGTFPERLIQFIKVAVSCAAVYLSYSAIVRDRRTRETQEKPYYLRAEEWGQSDGQHLDLSR